MAKKKTAKRVSPTARRGPYIVTAILCENVLQDQKGTHSFINVLDVLTVSGETDVLQPGVVRFTMALNFKSGDFRGIKRLKIVTNPPTTEPWPVAEMEIKFEGDEHGPATFMAFNFAVKEAGLFWFDVLLDGEMATRIPLRIRYEKKSLTAAVSPPAAKKPPKKS